jgi:hypothetical protein
VLSHEWIDDRRGVQCAAITEIPGADAKFE